MTSRSRVRCQDWARPSLQPRASWARKPTGPGSTAPVATSIEALPTKTWDPGRFFKAKSGSVPVGFEKLLIYRRFSGAFVLEPWRICAKGMVQKYSPYPPRKTVLSVKRKAAPNRGPKLLLSGTYRSVGNPASWAVLQVNPRAL